MSLSVPLAVHSNQYIYIYIYIYIYKNIDKNQAANTYILFGLIDRIEGVHMSVQLDTFNPLV
jgi:hypothetical protein